MLYAGSETFLDAKGGWGGSLASYPGPEKGPGIYCLRMHRHRTFLWGIENYSNLVMFHDRTLLKHASRYILVENDGGQFW